MARYGMVINARLCMGCDGCTTACKDEYVGNTYPGYSAAQHDAQYGYYPGATLEDGPVSEGPLPWYIPGQKWMDRVEVVRGTFPNLKVTTYSLPCMMCENPPCITESAKMNGAFIQRPDGILLLDPTKSQGLTDIPGACPYGKIFWNPEKSIPQKCTFCAHRVDQGKLPKCVDQCHMNAITFGDLDDPNSTISKLIAIAKPQPLHPEYGTKPKVLYIGLPKTFIMGKVVDAKTGAYLQGASVNVSGPSGTSLNATVDNYGDFTVDGLDAPVTYKVTISLANYATYMQTVDLKTDTHLGNITMNPSA